MTGVLCRLQTGTVCRAALGLRCSQGRHGRLVQLVSTLCVCALFGRERTLQRVRRLRSRACLHDWFECVEAIFGVRDMNVVGCIYVIAQMSFIAGASWPRSQAVPKQMGFQLGRLEKTEGVPNKTVAVLTEFHGRDSDARISNEFKKILFAKLASGAQGSSLVRFQNQFRRLHIRRGWFQPFGFQNT